MGRMVVGDAALAGDGLDDRDSALDRELRHDILGKRVPDAAARDQDRLLRGLEERRCFGEFLTVRTPPRNCPRPLLEENFRIVERYFLNVLRKPDEGRTAVGRIQHRGDRLRQR